MLSNYIDIVVKKRGKLQVKVIVKKERAVYSSHILPALVVQWIEQIRPKDMMGVRFPPRALKHSVPRKTFLL